MNFDPPLSRRNEIALTKPDPEKIRETDPILSRTKMSMFERNSCKEFRRIRDGKKKKKKIVQLGQTNTNHTDWTLKHEDGSISPIHKRMLDSEQKYRENFSKDVSLLNNLEQPKMNMVFEGSNGAKWNIFNKEFGYGPKYILFRDNNYSNNGFGNRKDPIQRKGLSNSKEEFNADRNISFTTETGAVSNHRFFNQSKLDDNLHEDVHSFIDKHIKKRQNIRDSYLYQNSDITKRK